MVITFANQKGGVGKSTLSLNYAYETVIRTPLRALLLDADPQGSLLNWSEKRVKELPLGLNILGMPKKTIHRDIKNLRDVNDHIIIDTPASTADITRSALLASNIVVIPCTPSEYDIWASGDTVEIVRETKIYNPELKCVFVINRKIGNTNIGKKLKDKILELGNDIHIMEAEISQRVAWAKSANGLFIEEIKDAHEAIKEMQLFCYELRNIALEGGFL